ncbi:hypothetical protein Tco_1428106 [Tanacetum coccineum]
MQSCWYLLFFLASMIHRIEEKRRKQLRWPVLLYGKPEVGQCSPANQVVEGLEALLLALLWEIPFEDLMRVLYNSYEQRLEYKYVIKDDMETDYFALGITQLRGDDIGWFGGILVMYLFRHAEGRKRGAELSGGHFIGHLAAYFGLVSDQGLRDLSVVC